MKARARIIALGQAVAGDDGVGLAILEELRRNAGCGPGVELLRAAEDAALIDLLATDTPVILIDAVIGEPAGRLLVLSPEDLEQRAAAVVSTHGLGAGRAIALARVLNPESAARSIRIVAVTVARPSRYEEGLSPAVAAAVPQAAAQVRALLEA